MKSRAPILLGVLLLLSGAIVAGLKLSRPPGGHNPKDLGYWFFVGSGKDWSFAAAQGVPEAEFQQGVALLRTNFMISISRNPLSSLPLVGKRFFEKTSYAINSSISAEQLAEAHAWIKKAADQGYAPAREAEKLFGGPRPAPLVPPAAVVAPSNSARPSNEVNLTPDHRVPGSIPAGMPAGIALNSTQATEFAEKLANDRAESMYQCRPFVNTASARRSGTGWTWRARCGYRQVDFEATVSFETDGAGPKVDIVVLDSRAVAPLLQRR